MYISLLALTPVGRSIIYVGSTGGSGLTPGYFFQAKKK
jgi:hypothetical protein